MAAHSLRPILTNRATNDYDKYDDSQDSAQEMKRREQVLQGLQLDHPLMTYAVDNLSFHISRAREGDPELFKALDSYLLLADQLSRYG